MVCQGSNFVTTFTAPPLSASCYALVVGGPTVTSLDTECSASPSSLFSFFHLFSVSGDYITS
jgi:hypothetical protein